MRQLLLILGALTLSVVSCRDQASSTTEPSSRASSLSAGEKAGKPPPVLLIGADGLDLKLVRRLARRGRLPNLSRLMEQGASGVLLSEREIRSPAIWTTIATGRPRAVHGIYDFVTGSRLWPRDRRSDEKRLVTSKMRKARAIWNLASAEGRSVAVVGWLNTWPAEKVNGVMVSPYVAIGRAKQITIKGNVYPDEPYQVHPAARWKEIKALITTPEDVPDELVDRFVGELDEALLSEVPLIPRYLDGLRWSLSHTLTMKEIALQLMKEEAPDLTMVYLEGADSLGHRFWLFRRSVAHIAAQLEEAKLPAEHAEELRATFGEVIDRYYELLDEVVGELLAALPADGQVLVVSDHGFGNRSGLYKLPKSTPFTGEHRLEGTIILAGDRARAGAIAYGATIYDITPTLVDLLGLEAKLPFEGHSLLPSLTEEPDPGSEADHLAEGPATDNEAFRDQEMERLRSLGYVQ